jgi:hypothetical protein
MLRICSDFSNNAQNVQNLFWNCSQWSEFSDNVQTMFRICSKRFRQCSECSDFSGNVQNVQNLFLHCSSFSDSVQTMFRILRICSEFSVNVQNVQNLFRIFRICSDFLRISSTKTGLFRISWLCSDRDVTTWAKYSSALPKCTYPSTYLLQATNSLINSHMWQRWAPWEENKALHRRYIHVFNIWLKYDKLCRKYYKLINLKKKPNQIHILYDGQLIGISGHVTFIVT